MSDLRKNIMLGTAGHVDHGKTALVKLLTGCDTDRLAAEKKRGLTIELGFAPCRMTNERIVGIVDVPGHVDFIHNMVAGAHGVDVVILVVAADDGVMPQTREHLDILTLMGVRAGLIALTKIDLVDTELRAMVAGDVRQFVAGTFLADAPLCGVSNITGEGFDAFFSALNGIVDGCEPRTNYQPFRMWIERAFSVHGYGTVVSGIPTSGAVAVGDRLSVVSGGQAVRVRGLEVYGQSAETGRAGECVALNLADADPALLPRGAVLCGGDVFVPVTMVEADLALLGRLPRGIKDYAEVHLHVGTAEAMAHVALLAGEDLAPGERAMVQLRLAEPLCIAAGDRFVIRYAMAGRLTTIGGGRVLDTSNVRLRRKRPWTLEALAARAEAIDDPVAWCELNSKAAGAALTADELARRSQMSAEAVESALATLKANGALLAAAGGEYLHRDVVGDCSDRMTEALREFHQANPARAGLAESDLRERVGADAAVFELAAARLLADGAVSRSGAALGLAELAPKISAADRQLCDKVESALLEAQLAAPGLAELADDLGEPIERVEKMIDVLVDSRLAVRLGRKVVLHAEAVASAKQVVLELFGKATGFSTMAFRDALGVSRKYAVPLLDYFDSIKLTVRTGNRRTAGAEARRLMQPSDE